MSSRSSLLVVVAAGSIAAAAAACPPARIECGPTSQVFRTIDTVQVGDSLLRLSRLDSIRCDRLELELQELEESIEVDTVAAALRIRRLS